VASIQHGHGAGGDIQPNSGYILKVEQQDLLVDCMDCERKNRMTAGLGQNHSKEKVSFLEMVREEEGTCPCRREG
jgi:hypothetical protein